MNPYVQVAARLQAHQMSHSTDKVDLCAWSGTWSGFTQAIQYWFIRELFRALNECHLPNHIQEHLSWYTSFGLQNTEGALSSFVAERLKLAVLDDTVV